MLGRQQSMKDNQLNPKSPARSRLRVQIQVTTPTKGNTAGRDPRSILRSKSAVVMDRKRMNEPPASQTPLSYSRLTPHSAMTRTQSCHDVSRVKKFRTDDNETPLAKINRLKAQNSTTPLKARGKPNALFAFQTPQSMPRRNIVRTPVQNRNVLPATGDATASSHGEMTSHGEEEKSHLIVAVRVRPVSIREKLDGTTDTTVIMHGNNVLIGSHTFQYDHCFWSCDTLSTSGYATQDIVFNTTAKPLINKAFHGYNACLFAYGQTGSGKSYSMMGHLNERDSDQPGPNAGIIPRSCQEIFVQSSTIQNSIATNKQPTVRVKVSYFEIYNEKIRDLLVTNDTKQITHKVREHATSGPYVEGLSSYVVGSYSDVQNWLLVGNTQRATSATTMNDKSSRSHSVFTVQLTIATNEMLDGEVHDLVRVSQINFVDLAGSERLAQSATGDRLKESVSINRSLLTLGKVIAALADRSGGRKTFIPYRDSVLTWLLKESLGGNSKTAMLATISPCSVYTEETLSTLRYACQASHIVNTVRVNEDDNARLVRDLRAEIERLKTSGSHPMCTPQHKRQSVEQIGIKELEIKQLKTILKNREEQYAAQEVEWITRLAEADKQRTNEISALEQSGLGIGLQSSRTCLVNISEDPFLSGKLLYLLPSGQTSIGRIGKKGDIVLDGPLIGVHHCTISNKESVLTLDPVETQVTYINGQLVTTTTTLHHGDHLLIGDKFYFQVNNPSDDEPTCRQQIVDFEAMKREVLNNENQLQPVREKILEKRLEELVDMEEKSNEERKKQEESYQKLLIELEEKRQIISQYESEMKQITKEKQVLQQAITQNKLDETITPSIYNSNFLDWVSSINEQIEVENREEEDIETMIEEANQLCKEIGKSLTFYKHEMPGYSKLVAKVVDNKNKLTAFWDRTKLVARLEQLKEIAEDESVGTFDFPSDTWLSDDTTSTNTTEHPFLISLLQDMLNLLQTSPHLRDECIVTSKINQLKSELSVLERDESNPLDVARFSSTDNTVTSMITNGMS